MIPLDELLPHMSTHFEKLPRAIGDLSETGCAYQWCTEIEKVILTIRTRCNVKNKDLD